MSDDVSTKQVLSNAKPRESMDPYQSLWVAHWTQTSQNPLSQVHQHQTINDERRKEYHNIKQGGSMPLQIAKSRKAKTLESDMSVGDISESKYTWKFGQGDFDIASDVLQSAKGTVPEARRTEIKNKSLMWNSEDLVSPDLNSARLDLLLNDKLCGSSVHHEDLNTSSFPCFRNKISEWQSSRNFVRNKKMEGTSLPSTDFSLCNRFCSQLEDKFKYGSADRATRVQCSQPRVLTSPPDEIHLKTEGKQGTSKNLVGLDYFEPHVRSLRENHTVSNSNSMLFKFSESHIIKEGDQSSLGLSHEGHLGNNLFSDLDPEHHNCHSYSPLFASVMKMDQKLISESSQSQYSGHKDRGLCLNDDPVIGGSQIPTLLGGQGGKMKKFCGLFPRDSSNQQTLLEDLKCQQLLLHIMPTCCFHDIEELQICTTVDSVEGVPGGLTKFSETTNHLFFSKKPDMNFSDRDQMIKESTVSAENQGNAFHRMLAVHRGLCCGEQEPNFRHVVKLAGSEEKEDGNTAMTGLQNESSAETDSMPIDFHQSKSAACGVTSSLLHEDFMAGKSKGISLEPAVSQGKRVGVRKEAAELPDAREELPADLAADGNLDNRELSMSRTESLDAEHLLSHVEHPENSNCSPQNGNPLYSQPSSRWVKRLRLSATDSHAFGTKCLKMGDSSSSDKVNKLFNNITSYNRARSESTSRTSHGKELQQFDKTSVLFRNVDSSEGLGKAHLDLSLSHSWIRRWCRSQKPTKEARIAPEVAFEPENLKFSLELQKKQFPSIAAMALMGKAVSSFRPCEFQKKGSLVVWNTEGYRKF